MNENSPQIIEQLALAASRLQAQRTGHAPKSVSVILSEDTLVMTLHEALTQAEKVLAQSPEGAAQVQEFHRELFSSSIENVRREIERITGRKVHAAAVEIEATTGAVIHAFTTGTMVQVFLLSPNSGIAGADAEAIDRANDEGLRPPPAAVV